MPVFGISKDMVLLLMVLALWLQVGFHVQLLWLCLKNQKTLEAGFSAGLAAGAAVVPMTVCLIG